MSKFYDLLLAKSLGGGGGGTSGLEYEAGEWTPSEDVAHGEITFSKTHSEAPFIFVVAYDDDPSKTAENTMVANVYVDVYKMIGAGLPYGNTGNYYRYVFGEAPYTGSAGAALNAQGVFCGKDSDSEQDSDSNWPRFWAKETGIYPYGVTNARVWKSGIKYKWIAIWKPSE